MHDLVSIIIPFYNAIDFIEATIDSAINQSYKNTEIIVVNDGCLHDLTPLLKNKFGNEPKIMYFTKPNGGPSSARNFGIEKSKGKYLAFLDQDDLWHPNKIKEQIALINKDPSLGIVSCLSYVIDENNLIKGPQLGKVINGNAYKDFLFYDYISGGSVAFIKKECINKIGNFDTNILGREDWDLWIRICKEYKIGTVNKKLVAYRRSTNNLSDNYKSMIENGVKTINKLTESDASISNSHKKQLLIKNELSMAGLAIRDEKYTEALKLINNYLRNCYFKTYIDRDIFTMIIFVYIINIIKNYKLQKKFIDLTYKIFFNCARGEKPNFTI